MGLFGFGSKRELVPAPIALRPLPGKDTPATLPLRSNGDAGRTRTAFTAAKMDRLAISMRGPGVERLDDVEVRELDLDDEEFSSTFGSSRTQFADAAARRDDAVDDPWASRLRVD